MSKRIPRFKSDEEAERFLEQDLTDYLDPQYFRLARIEFIPKNKTVTFRISSTLLEQVKALAKSRGVNYQKLIREGLELVVRRGLKKKTA
ncbi:MAG: CopG family transcriptional regulator [Deltaproteobacteria bacterium]|nr:CopG family transcriptional regulator [Deltaproteobacteria bacterium]